MNSRASRNCRVSSWTPISRSSIRARIRSAIREATQAYVELAEMGVHRYNHNLETARSHFSKVVTTHSYDDRHQTCELVRRHGMELCCGVLLGMGEDGHVASLFPGIPALGETERWVVATEAPPSSPVRDRLSLTLPVLNAGRVTLFLVAGEAKRDAFAAALRDPDRSPPAERVTARDRLLWYVDEAAAGAVR